jgi:hypothetical protein
MHRYLLRYEISEIVIVYTIFTNSVRASLRTLIFHGIFIFPRENELISLGKIKIPWKISVSKLALSLYSLRFFFLLE